MIKEHLLKNPLFVIVVSEKRKFIYLKITKTAGTSILRETIQKQIHLDIIMDLPHTFSYKKSFLRNQKWMQNLNDEKLKDYFIFTFVRNPWDRLVSVYFNFREKKLLNQEISFEDFIKNKMFEDDKLILLKAHSLPQAPYVECNGKIFVNFIGRFENLEEDWKIVAEKIGVDSKLPIANKTEHEHYTKYYNKETRMIVAEKYKRDIELFGYKF